jgi:phage-related protein
MKAAVLVIYLVFAGVVIFILVRYLIAQRKKIKRFQDRCTAKTTGTFAGYRYRGTKKPKVTGVRFSYRAPDGETIRPVFPIQSEPFHPGDTMEFWYDPDNYYFVCTDSMIKSMKRERIQMILFAALWLFMGIVVVLNYWRIY